MIDKCTIKDLFQLNIQIVDIVCVRCIYYNRHTQNDDSLFVIWYAMFCPSYTCIFGKIVTVRDFFFILLLSIQILATSSAEAGVIGRVESLIDFFRWRTTIKAPFLCRLCVLNWHAGLGRISQKKPVYRLRIKRKICH